MKYVVVITHIISIKNFETGTEHYLIKRGMIGFRNATVSVKCHSGTVLRILKELGTKLKVQLEQIYIKRDLVRMVLEGCTGSFSWKVAEMKEQTEYGLYIS